MLKCRGIIIKTIIIYLSIVLGTTAAAAGAIEYPYVLPAELSATLNVDTDKKVPFNNMLIGLNCAWPANLYSGGYNDLDAQALIADWKPHALRWPDGVWANFYDWEVDGRRIYDGYTGTYYNAVINWPNYRYGFPGLHALYDSLGFDVLFTWNVNYDSPEKGVARLQDRLAKGFEIKWIELGNENYWLDQRSEAIDTPEKYVAVAKAHSQALKAVHPTVKLSIPVPYRSNISLDAWTGALQADDSYYDAVSMHRYIRSDGTRAEDVKQALKAASIMLETAQIVRARYPGKPIWVTEWSTKVGDGANAATVLGNADVYLTLFSHPEYFEMAQYFTMQNHDPLITYYKSTNTHKRTSLGASYDIIRDVFLDSELYACTLNTTNIDVGLDAVSAKTVLKNGITIVYAINKTTNSIPLALEFDGSSYQKAFNHQAFVFSDINDYGEYGLTENVLVPIALVADGIMLPPLSINVIRVLAPELSPSADYDGDGFSNGEELIAGTNPEDARSRFTIDQARADNRMKISWASYTGRTYSVEYTPTLAGSDWVSILGDLSGTGEDMEITDLIRASGNAFYRCTVTYP